MTNLIVNGRQARELLRLNRKLQRILGEILDIWPVDDCVITCIWRSEEENEAAGAVSKIHVVGPPYRAIDLRITNLGVDYQVPAEEIADTINAIWTYDPTRLTKQVLYAKPHGTGPHIHCQVHPKTVRIN